MCCQRHVSEAVRAIIAKEGAIVGCANVHVVCVCACVRMCVGAEAAPTLVVAFALLSSISDNG